MAALQKLDHTIEHGSSDRQTRDKYERFRLADIGAVADNVRQSVSGSHSNANPRLRLTASNDISLIATTV